MRRATLAYIAPFFVFVGLMAMASENTTGWPPGVLYAARFAATVVALWVFSRHLRPFPARYPLASIGVGVAVFVIWILPDLLFGYRHFWLFQNAFTGVAASSLPAKLRINVPFVVLRAASSTLLVPVIEELFWRGWLMRWLIGKDFLKVPLGTYVPSAFWIVAVLFASEHGPYWEVGLAAGIIYNYWIVRTKCLGDCILAHAVTNGILSAYVVLTGQWQYWL
ncbi:MAG TPA: CAAX prenyl protease-related protein [Bryobacteraceae bacterium]|nr:CAAX prenyl protease-related protein [Bryobacteraceae bacterium]